MSTYNQTVELYFENSIELKFFSIEERPVAPAGLLEKVQETLVPHGYITPEGEILAWTPNGMIQVQTADKTCVKQFWSKPTLKDAVKYKHGNSYWRFFQDGSVMSTAYGNNYYYGPSKMVERPVVEFYPMARGTDGDAWQRCTLEEATPWTHNGDEWIPPNCSCEVCHTDDHEPTYDCDYGYDDDGYSSYTEYSR